jgi:hypothetical protein
MPHFSIEMVVVLACLFTGVVSLRQHDKRVGLGFLCSSIGTLGIALERVIPTAAPWLGTVSSGVLVLGSALFIASLWRARQRRMSTHAD